MEKSLEAASRFAQLAFADEAAGRHVEALAHAGVALELLAKAVLINAHPLLVIESGRNGLNLPGMKAALEGGDLSGPGVRTINVNEALRRCSELVKGFEWKAYNDLIDARNGSLQVGRFDAAVVSGALALLVDASERLLPALDVEADDFWGTSAQPAAATLAEYTDEVRKRVADWITDAAASWYLAKDALSEAELQALRATAPLFAMGDEQESWECPACHETAVLEGELDVEDVVDWEYDDGEAHAVGGSFLILKPYRLTCPFCRLRLVGPGELKAAGITADIQIEREHEADIIAGLRYDHNDYEHYD